MIGYKNFFNISQKNEFKNITKTYFERKVSSTKVRELSQNLIK